MTAASPFHATAPLPAGTVLLEASAGTGKTHTITSLVLRLVAEDGVALDRILIVTFTRAAAAELRDRVRNRLTQATRAFERARSEGGTASDVAAESDDEVVRHLLESARAAPDDELTRRWRRLRAAAERFDDATIDTIHGFCQRTLQRAAPDVVLDTDAELSGDLGGVVDELVQDALVRELRTADEDWFRFVTGAGIDAPRLRSIALRLENEPDLTVLPRHPHAQADPVAAWAEAVRQFRTAWIDEGDELVAWLCEHAGAFRGSYYNRRRPIREGQAITDWCEHASPGVGDLSGVRQHLTYVSAHEMAARSLDRDALPDHFEVARAADALLRTPGDLATGVLCRFADHVRAELPRRKRARGIVSFTDLLVALDRSLRDEATRSAVRAGIRARFDVALIDEFQDTDPVQWRIFDGVFGEDARLRLIGDPKQAIYGFRGADVHTYLAARATVPAASRFTLSTNHRSDARYLAALEELFGRSGAFEPDGVFAVPEIRHVPVEATAANQQDRLLFADGPRPPLEVRYVSRSLQADGADDEPDPDRLVPHTWARPFLARVVAREIVELLLEEPTIHAGGVQRPLAPRDIAVLVRTNDQARRVQRALVERGVPAVVGADDSVFASADATALQRLLDALLQPSSDRLLRAALAGPILGFTASQLAAAETDDEVLERVERWARTWRARGVAALLREVLADTKAAARLVTRPWGERTLTNLAHLSELLHAAEASGRLGPDGLATWLREQRQVDSVAGEDRQLRLESDQDAVTVATVHRSKGLQYPVVWCPDLWDGRLLFPADHRVLRFHDPDSGRLSLDLAVGTDASGKRRHLAFAQRERWQEQLRLLYVALTRAKHRCIVHTGPFADVGTSPLQRLLHGAAFGESDGLPSSPPDPRGVSDAALFAELEALASDNVGVRRVEPAAGDPRWERRWGPQVPLRARRLGRSLDRTWQRTSFSRLTAAGDVGAHEAPATASDATAVVSDDGSPATRGRDHGHHLVDDDESGGTGEPVQHHSRAAAQSTDGHGRTDVTLADFPRGPEPGTFLHELFEHLDFTRADPSSIRSVIAARAPRANLPELGPGAIDRLVTGVGQILTTSLGPELDETCLADVEPHDRLDELDFDLPLAGGYRDDATPVDLHMVAEVFERHAGAGAAPLAAYGARLRRRPRLPVSGFLTGSIDLVLRRGGPEGPYLVIDYKSNWLSGAVDPTRSVGLDYHPDRLAEEMVAHDYVLQYHLYLVALHRFLRWRLGARYDYDVHVGGIRYLFLRGMTGPETPRTRQDQPFGVYADRPSRALVEELDAVLAGERR